MVGEFTTHFRTYFSGDWDVHWVRLGFLPMPKWRMGSKGQKEAGQFRDPSYLFNWVPHGEHEAFSKLLLGEPF